MEHSRTTTTTERAERRSFQIDPSSLLQNRTPTKDRVGFLRTALGDKNSGASNGVKNISTEDLYKPLPTKLNIDRTQSLMKPAGYSSNPAYKSLRDPMSASRAQSLNPQASVSFSSLSTTRTYSQDGEGSPNEHGIRTGLSPTTLTRSSISESNLIEAEESRQQYIGPVSSYSSFSRGGSTTPTEGDRSETPVGKETRPPYRQLHRIPAQRSSSSSSDDGETEEHSTQGRVSKLGYSSSDSSRTPVTSPLPKTSYAPVANESLQREPEKSQTNAIFGLKTALDLAQKKNAENKKIIENLKHQLIKCKEERTKEDPVLKAALEDALRELRENKEVIAVLKQELNQSKRTTDSLQKDIAVLQANLQETEHDLSEDANNYRDRVMALEQENVELKKEKEELGERLVEVSSTLETHESEILREKQELETSLREMAEKVTDTQKDKLYAAIKTHDIEAIEKLLQSTAVDLDAVITPDNTGRRAIHLLADNIKMAPIITMLIKAKVDLNAIDNDGESALHIAARSGRGRIVKMLLEAKADSTIVNSLGWTPVQVAAAVGNVSALEEFRKCDPASLKFKDDEGSTLLHYTCANNQKKASNWLVRHGSSKRRKDAYGLAAQDYKEAAKADDGLMACFGGGGKKLAHEQLPRLQLQSAESFRKSQDLQGSGSIKLRSQDMTASGSFRHSMMNKNLTETDQSSHATISEKQFIVSSETEAEVCEEPKVTRKNSSSRSVNRTPERKQNFNRNMSARRSKRKSKPVSIGSDSGLSEDISSAVINRASKTTQRSETSALSLLRKGSVSEDQSSDISMISSQRSFKERLPTGLPNLGSTSYMNAILQCLYYTKPLSDNFIYRRYKDNINHKSSQGGEVANTFAEIITALRNGKQTVAAVKQMKEIAGTFDKKYFEDEAQDAHDFLLQILQWLHQDLSKDISLSEKMPNSQVSVISTLFFGVHLSTIVCQETGKDLNVNEEIFSTLSLPVQIAEGTDLKDLLATSYKPKLVLWSCSECGKDHMCLKKLKIIRPPTNLIIHFNREDEIKGNLMNAKTKLTYPQDDLCLAEYFVDTKRGNFNYELYAICNQKGHGSSAQHSACCMTAKPPIWCLFNDLSVNPTTTEEVISQPDSHILFYKMASASPHSTGV